MPTLRRKITKRLVEMMGGEISVSSEKGVGSTFHVRLNNLESAPLADQEVEGIDVDAIEFADATILIADDVALNREVVKGYLASYPFAFQEAEDGQEALAAIRRDCPDLVLMDIKMPVLDGFRATQMIKADPSTNGVPVIALTAYAMQGDRERMLEAGFTSYIAKPFHLDLLEAELQRLLQ